MYLVYVQRMPKRKYTRYSQIYFSSILFISKITVPSVVARFNVLYFRISSDPLHCHDLPRMLENTRIRSFFSIMCKTFSL